MGHRIPLFILVVLFIVASNLLDCSKLTADALNIFR
jgi:hypothetical protein